MGHGKASPVEGNTISGKTGRYAKGKRLDNRFAIAQYVIVDRLDRNDRHFFGHFSAQVSQTLRHFLFVR
jgi:hypothetical protein